MRDQLAARFKARTRQSPWGPSGLVMSSGGTLASGREFIVHHVVSNCNTETSQKPVRPDKGKKVRVELHLPRMLCMHKQAKLTASARMHRTHDVAGGF
jgi:hypothetical protein